jgi:hypothetical protein
VPRWQMNLLRAANNPSVTKRNSPARPYDIVG